MSRSHPLLTLATVCLVLVGLPGLVLWAVLDSGVDWELPDERAASDAADPGAEAAPAATPLARSIVIFTVDTLRADQLGAYGNSAYPTPAFDRVAQSSLVFERAYTQATITHPALSSMLTGLLPRNHAVRGQAGLLARDVPTLPMVLKEHGFATGSFVANLCKHQEQRRTVFHDGWDTTFCGMGDDDQYLWDARVVDAAMAWIAEQDGPYLAWIHLMDPHAEHRPDPARWDYEQDPPREKIAQYKHYNTYEYERRFPPPDDYARLWALYGAEVQSADAELGRLLEFLASLPQAAETALIVSADHGEELYETWSRYDHGLSMSEGVLWIPLMVCVPGLAPGRFDDPVELLQVTPTVYQIAGVVSPTPLAAPSLLSERPSRGFAVSSYIDVSYSIRTKDRRYWLRGTLEPFVRGEDEYPWRAEAPWFQQRESLAEYPGKRTGVKWRDLSEPDAAAEVEALRWKLYRLLQEGQAKQESEKITDPETLKMLEALGYAEDAPEQHVDDPFKGLDVKKP